MNEGKTGSLGARLKAYGLITDAQLEEALARQREKGGRLGEILIELGHLQEDAMTWCLANQLDLACVNSIDTERPDPTAVDALPAELAWRHHMVPLLLADHELTVVTDDPLDTAAIEEVAELTGLRIQVAVASPTTVTKALESLYPREESRRDASSPLIRHSPFPSPHHQVERLLDRFPLSPGSRVKLRLTPTEHDLRYRLPDQPWILPEIDRREVDMLVGALEAAEGREQNAGTKVLRVRGMNLGVVTYQSGDDKRLLLKFESQDDQVVRFLPHHQARLASLIRQRGLWLIGVDPAIHEGAFFRGIEETLKPALDIMTPMPRPDGPSTEPSACASWRTLSALEPDGLLIPSTLSVDFVREMPLGRPGPFLGIGVGELGPRGGLLHLADRSSKALLEALLSGYVAISSLTALEERLGLGIEGTQLRLERDESPESMIPLVMVIRRDLQLPTLPSEMVDENAIRFSDQSIRGFRDEIHHLRQAKAIDDVRADILLERLAALAQPESKD